MFTIDDIRTKVRLSEHKTQNVHSTDFPWNYPGYDDAWDEKKFKKNFRIAINRIRKETRRHARLEVELDDVDEIEFDMVGIDAAIANAIRRILIAEVPTMAIEEVHVQNNTSIMQDEVLAHRLGLIPISADPHLFEYRSVPSKGNKYSERDMGKEQDTLVFHLSVQCEKQKRKSDATEPVQMIPNLRVTSKYLEWLPLGNQKNVMKVGPVKDNILITILKPGQEIDLRMFCVKGIGKDHAKFSPVATATYRLLPRITLLRPVYGEQAKKLQKCFSPGVIELREGERGEEAVVVNARKDTMRRDVFQHEDLKDAVQLEKIRDHFIFSVESTGIMRPDELVVEAVRVLQTKCQTLLEELESRAQAAGSS